MSNRANQRHDYFGVDDLEDFDGGADDEKVVTDDNVLKRENSEAVAAAIGALKMKFGFAVQRGQRTDGFDLKIAKVEVSIFWNEEEGTVTVGGGNRCVLRHGPYKNGGSADFDRGGDLNRRLLQAVEDAFILGGVTIPLVESIAKCSSVLANEFSGKSGESKCLN